MKMKAPHGVMRHLSKKDNQGLLNKVMPIAPQVEVEIEIPSTPRACLSVMYRISQRYLSQRCLLPPMTPDYARQRTYLVLVVSAPCVLRLNRSQSLGSPIATGMPVIPPFGTRQTSGGSKHGMSTQWWNLLSGDHSRPWCSMWASF